MDMDLRRLERQEKMQHVAKKLTDQELVLQPTARRASDVVESPVRELNLVPATKEPKSALLKENPWDDSRNLSILFPYGPSAIVPGGHTLDKDKHKAKHSSNIKAKVEKISKDDPMRDVLNLNPNDN
jgi:hypothetical protein